MRCHRCNSPMVYQKFYDIQDQFWGWRCIFCGEIVDELIAENRLWMTAASESPRKRR